MTRIEFLYDFGSPASYLAHCRLKGVTARTGAEVKGVVTFHGLFDPPPFETAAAIPARVLALHGWDDPLARPEAVIAFAAEMTAKTRDWQLHAFGHTEHGFTAKHRPQAYRPDADRRAWQALENFLNEIF